MAEEAVVNASPLIYLARAGFLDLLRLGGEKVVVPAAVAEEVLARGPTDPTAQALGGTPWLRVVETPPPPARVLAWNLGAGESAVIAWALAHPGCRAVIDDLLGRRCAESLELPLRGTLGLVLRARQTGVIDKARPVLDEDT